jgi:Rieske Fe-S protein
MNSDRRTFLIATAKIGCAALCGAALLHGTAGCDHVEQGDAVIDLTRERDLQQIGGAIKKRFAKINNGDPVLVIHETEQLYVAYSALCTHKGVEVRLPKNGVIICPNHGSRFSAAEGKVLDGLAFEPLKQIPVRFDPHKFLLTLG